MTKKILALLFSVIIWVIPTYGQLSKNITVNTPGTLESQLGADKTKITDLVLTGTINSADFTTIKQMTLLKSIDMSTVNITNGTFPGGVFQGKVMTKIILPASLKILGNNAFEGMSVSDLNFANCLGLEEIGYSCFAGLKTTTGVLDFSKNTLLTRFPFLNLNNGTGTFSYCNQHVILPNNLITLPANMFKYFKGTIDFPLTLEKIGDGAFSEAVLTDALVLPSGVKVIGNSSFYNMAVSNLDFTKCIGLEEIGYNCFAGLKSTTGVLDFSKNTSLSRFLYLNLNNGTGTFSYCNQHVILPNNLVTLPANTFKYFKGTIDFPLTLEKIGDGAFVEAVLTEALILSPGVKVIGNRSFAKMSVPNIEFTKCTVLEEIGYSCFEGLKTTTGILDFSKNISLSRFIQLNIGTRPVTFTDCSQHVILPSNMITIPSYSFYGFKGSITFSPVLETIGESAFANSVFTKGIVFPNSLKTIDTKAFYNSTIPNVSFEQMDPSQSGVSCF
uniref:leucine-rich repeat domain-containing protein n=1 Tax=uncultured Dysgonomonas sp. TaxID=206096 RepID=UPI00262E7579|nr:leucine-rich repeat domain-containing protein [uncultured Dysgonomonas sp.]